MKSLTHYILCLLLLAPLTFFGRANLTAIRAELDKKPENEAKIELYLDAARDINKEHPREALDFSNKALALAQKLKSKDGVVKAYSNFGLLYINQDKISLAKENLTKSISLKAGLIKSNSNYKNSISKDYRLMGYCFEKERNLDRALEYYQRGVNYAIEGKNNNEIIEGFNSVGDVHHKLENYQDALRAYGRSHALAKKLGLRKKQLEIEKSQATSYSLLQNYMEKQQYVMELEEFEEEIDVIRDSLTKEQDSKQILVKENTLLEIEKEKTEAEVKAKEQEVKAKEQELLAKEADERNIIIAGGAGLVIFLLIFVGLISRIRSKKRAAIAIGLEKEKSDALLLNILPENVANVLKESGKVSPTYHPMVSILFTDFKGFTSIATKLDPVHLVEKLETAFEVFDEITEKYGLEKIKTIGDAYMAVAGLTKNDPHHAINAVAAAMEMQEFMDQWIGKQKRRGEEVWELRIGIHSGPVVAGVIGQKKFAYDIWGDAVNLASRMESNGSVGKVNVSTETYELIKPFCSFEAKRTVRLKSKGMIDMYYVRDITAKRRAKPKAQPKAKKKSRWF